MTFTTTMTTTTIFTTAITTTTTTSTTSKTTTTITFQGKEHGDIYFSCFCRSVGTAVKLVRRQVNALHLRE